ncbi:MAG: hypothetical protein ACON4O_00970 [Lentimonas sp.]
MKKIVPITLTALCAAFIFQARAVEPIDFGSDIYPILRENCLSCHAAPYTDTRGRLRKPKDGIRLDTPEWVQKGHPKQDGTWETIIVPGNAGASSFYTLTILPEDHDDIMPAKGDPLTQEQTDLIKNWINQGANYGGFEAPEYVNPRSREAAEAKG